MKKRKQNYWTVGQLRQVMQGMSDRATVRIVLSEIEGKEGDWQKHGSGDNCTFWLWAGAEIYDADGNFRNP
ncbi:MAG: hypothetical protein WBM24_21230 [Candidatus Sulfotelmatobacter sp.]